jgi:hypothetical protein
MKRPVPGIPSLENPEEAQISSNSRSFENLNPILVKNAPIERQVQERRLEL